MLRLITKLISLSISAIIFQYLSKNREVNTPLGVLTTGVLLIQDILVVPMLLTLNFIAQGELSFNDMLLPVIGTVAIILFLRAAMRHRLFRWISSSV